MPKLLIKKILLYWLNIVLYWLNIVLYWLNIVLYWINIVLYWLNSEKIFFIKSLNLGSNICTEEWVCSPTCRQSMRENYNGKPNNYENKIFYHFDAKVKLLSKSEEFNGQRQTLLLKKGGKLLFALTINAYKIGNFSGIVFTNLIYSEVWALLNMKINAWSLKVIPVDCRVLTPWDIPADYRVSTPRNIEVIPADCRLQSVNTMGYRSYPSRPQSVNTKKYRSYPCRLQTKEC